MLVAAKAINIGRVICRRKLYGFFLVSINIRAGNATNNSTTRPHTTATINIPRSRNTLETSSIEATATKMRLSTPMGVDLWV